MTKNKQEYWYFIETEYCVVCGHEVKTRIRIYDEPKPENPADRMNFIENMCNNCIFG